MKEENNLSVRNESEIKLVLVDLAEYYNREITKKQLDMYCEDLSEYDFSIIKQASDEYRKDSENRFFPLPADLLAISKKITFKERIFGR